MISYIIIYYNVYANNLYSITSIPKISTRFNPIRSGGGGALKAPPPPLSFLALTHLILELHFCALGTFPKK